MLRLVVVRVLVPVSPRYLGTYDFYEIKCCKTYENIVFVFQRMFEHEALWFGLTNQTTKLEIKFFSD